jgi:antitoxin component YwqK of YwqJK toxin-antitoxin module
MKKLLVLLFSLLASFNSYSLFGLFGLFEKTICVETDAQIRDELYYLPNETKPFSGKNLCEYENGQIYSKGFVEDGKIEGKWTFWYENSQKMSEGIFTADDITKTKEIEYSQFIKDVNQGNVSTVKIRGSRITGLTSLGQKFETYNPGDLGLMGDLLKNGVSVHASPPGVQSENLINAKKIGKYTEWNENGQIVSESNWKDGVCISGDC